MSGLIPQRFIEDLLDRTDLAELIGSRLALKKAGASYKARCPFHDEKTPSFNVRPDKGFYHCFGCGAHGDAISFIREFEGLGFTEAVEELARKAGLEVPYDQTVRREMQQTRTLTEALDFANGFYQKCLASADGELARRYLEQRGLDASMVERYQLGYAPGAGAALYNAAGADMKAALIETRTVSDQFGRPRDLFRNRIMFPIRNTRGRTVAFGGRTLGDDKAKYINSPESDAFHKSREVYGLHEARQALRQIDRLLVVEGYMDVIALAQHGIQYTVAMLGTATNQESLTTLFRHARHLIFCFDGDSAGYRAADKAMENALELLTDGLHLQFLMLPEGEDPDTLIRKEGAQAFEQRIAGAVPLSRYLFDRQQEGLDLAQPEHRGELRARVEPLINRMPKGTLRDAMWHEMMRLCRPPRVPWQEYRQGRRHGQERDGTGRSGWYAGAPAEPVDIRRDKNHMLCLALLEAPDLADDIRNLCRQDRTLDRSGDFAAWILKNKARSRDDLLYVLATTPEARQRFGQLFDNIEHMPSREEALDSVRLMTAPDEEAARKQQHRALRGVSLSELSPEERQRLREALGGSASH